ncbi:hypothetical protein H072_3488 [Dactylellina haptotyla CBS 200.50]|uniref:Uncharacterized protein n=1 Tax=Dactylellina haptotyla (strain CBS 200.50) TaxID=1284197 RepID=S8AHN4_DACHA|nr:hypothetical protein H072_3488 [Dactylellina haptotyla CBS 200.50]
METLIKVKAGRCFPDSSNSRRLVPSDVPGEIQIVLSRDDELLHFKWVPRSGHSDDGEEFDLLLFPGDASFVPYLNTTGAPSDGRVSVLKFLSSDQRHFFWYQVKNEGLGAGEFSQKDWLITKKIDRLILSGGDLEGVTDEELLADQMELDDEAAPSAGESSRRGGADGGRASDFQPPSTIPTGGQGQSQSDLVASLIRGISVPGGGSGGPAQPRGFLTLPSLLQPTAITTVLESKPLRQKLLANLPPALTADVKSEFEEKDLLRKVLHSPQFAQATAMLTVALREGGLRGVADSLGVKLDLANAGAQGGVEIFVESIKKGAEGEDDEGDTTMS